MRASRRGILIARLNANETSYVGVNAASCRKRYGLSPNFSIRANRRGLLCILERDLASLPVLLRSRLRFTLAFAR